MITLIENDLEGMFAVPLEHPITCLNPAPWKITEMRIKREYDTYTKDIILKIRIRGKESCWFRADQCWIGSKEDCEDYIQIKGIK